MTVARKSAVSVGICFIVAAVTSIVALGLYGSVLHNSDYIIQASADDSQVLFGAVLELILAATAVGTAIGLFPFIKKHNESIALGYVCFRLFEAVLIVIGLISLLAIVTLRQEFATLAALNAPSFATAGRLLVAVHDWTFMLGPNFMLGINTLMCSYLLYKTRLVPRIIAILGQVGAVLIFTAALLEIFGVIVQTSAWGAVLALPIAAYEMSLAVWLIVKGFNLTALVPQPAQTTASEITLTSLSEQRG